MAFFCHEEMWVQCLAHCLMQHVQGYTGSLWMTPLGNYLLHIAPAAAMVPSKQQHWKYTAPLPAILMSMTMHRYNTKHIPQWRRSRASLEVTGCCHRASICSDSINWTNWHWFLCLFYHQQVDHGHEVKAGPLLTIGVWHIKLKRNVCLKLLYTLFEWSIPY